METVTFNTISIGGIKTACIDRVGLAKLIDDLSQRFEAGISQPFIIFDTNGHGISLAHTDPQFKALLDQADLIHADGQSIVSFSKRLDGPVVPERTATTDMIHDLPNYLDRPLKHYLLGGEDRVVNQAAAIMDEQYDKFEVAGVHHGFFSEAEEEALCEQINLAKPDVLWVGLGKPKEQAFCLRNKHRLHVPVIITCGGCYNYITGDYPRAPQWMQDRGLEWLHRLATNPRKLFWRYFITNPHSIYCVFMKKGH